MTGCACSCHTDDGLGVALGVKPLAEMVTLSKRDLDYLVQHAKRLQRQIDDIGRITDGAHKGRLYDWRAYGGEWE